MPRSQPTVFILWGDQFDEAAAVLFVTTLRKAGLRVKVIGVDGSCVKGVHGLGLLTDLTLDEALGVAEQAICVVIPCTTQIFLRVRADPRLQEFLERTQNGAVWIVSSAV